MFFILGLDLHSDLGNLNLGFLQLFSGLDNPYFPRFRTIDTNSLYGRYPSSTSSSSVSLGTAVQPLCPPFPGGFLSSPLTPSMLPLSYPKSLPNNGSFCTDSVTSISRGSGGVAPSSNRRIGPFATGVGEENGASSVVNNGIVHNTLRKTKSDMKVIHRYFVQVKNETREIHEIPPEDLCKHIQVRIECIYIRPNTY